MTPPTFKFVAPLLSRHLDFEYQSHIEFYLYRHLDFDGLYIVQYIHCSCSEYDICYYVYLMNVSVATHVPLLFHVVTLLVGTGPLSLQASTHGLVINIIHSLCTCSQLNFGGTSTAV